MTPSESINNNQFHHLLLVDKLGSVFPTMSSLDRKLTPIYTCIEAGSLHLFFVTLNLLMRSYIISQKITVGQSSYARIETFRRCQSSLLLSRTVWHALVSELKPWKLADP